MLTIHHIDHDGAEIINEAKEVLWYLRNGAGIRVVGWRDPQGRCCTIEGGTVHVKNEAGVAIATYHTAGDPV